MSNQKIRMEGTKFENLVCSPEMAIALMKAGVKQEAACWYQERMVGHYDFKADVSGWFHAPVKYAAFTCTWLD